MKSTPVICGLDLGSWSFKLCVFNGEKLEVLTNEANFRETPSLVGYTQTERLIGEAALIKLKTNYNNTIRAPQRLLGLQKHDHLLREQLKYEKVQYESEKDLVFSVQGRQGPMKVTVEEVLISLLGKAKAIIENHQLSLAIAYIAVPTYYGQQEREALKKCGELAFGRHVRLVDDWVCLSAQYTYNRLKQLKTLDQMRHVIFLDIGYSKVSIYLVQFTRFEGRLLDWEYLPYTGCKNMDENVCEYYSQLFQGQHKQSILKHPKAFVKLLDAVQRQRTVLSANNEYHLNLEYLLNEEDLTYNMKREDLETIIVPVLSDIAAAMAAIQSRNCSVPLHAVQLMGGASRIPCIQNMAAKIFGLEPSRGLNQSEAIAVGCTIYGALERKLLNLQYSYDSISTKEIGVRWGNQKKLIFSKKSKATTETSLSIGNEGIITMSVFVQMGVTQKEIGRLRFKTPNKVIFTIDENKLINAKLSLNHFQIYDFHQKNSDHWKHILQREEEMSKVDMRMGLIYEMKNDYESKFYNSKNKFEELRIFASPEQILEIEAHMKAAQHWIEEEHAKPVLATQGDFEKFTEKNAEISILKVFVDELDAKRKNIENMKVRYDRLSEQICIALQKNLKDKSREQVIEVLTWGQQCYQKMENNNWTGNQLTLQKLEQASVIIQNAL